MTNTLQVKLLSKNARMPERNHKTDAGYDIFSAETVVLEPQEKAVIKTDVAVSIPEGYVGLLTSRSGVSSKTYLVIETGKIDAGYHGNLGINIKNDNETHITRAKSNQRFTVVEAESKEEAKEKYESQNTPIVYYTNNSKVTLFERPSEEVLGSLFEKK